MPKVQIHRYIYNVQTIIGQQTGLQQWNKDVMIKKPELSFFIHQSMNNISDRQ